MALRDVGVAMMSVAVSPGDAVRPGAPVELFQGRCFYGGVAAAAQVYDLAPDGQRFLMITEGGTANPGRPEIVIVQNWVEELKRLVPTR